MKTSTKNHGFYYCVLALAWLCALWAYVMDADAKAQAQAERTHTARLAQLDQQRIERAAQAVCEQSHGPDAAHWWEGAVLVCARSQRPAAKVMTASAGGLQ